MRNRRERSGNYGEDGKHKGKVLDCVVGGKKEGSVKEIF